MDDRRKIIQPDEPDSFFSEADEFMPLKLRSEMKHKSTYRPISPEEQEEHLRRTLRDTYETRMNEYHEACKREDEEKEKSLHALWEKLGIKKK